jgi:hypothetical protein
MSDYGLKLSAPGFDITTNDPRNLIFSSAFNTMAIAVQGSSSQTGNSGDIKTFTIAHGLAFTPFALVFLNTSFFPSYWKMCPMMGNSPGAVDLIGNSDIVFNTDIRIDATNLVVRVQLHNGSSDTVTLKYYLFNAAI